MKFIAGEFDVAVIGAGHAGIEAGLAAARLGCKTAVFTINMDAVGNCPCNPSIGGTAKGHLVREIDALGGEMGKAADECFLQIRMLNRGKGPAVHSLRAQIDRRAYSTRMKHILELQENLELRQAEITDLARNDDGRWILTTRLEAQYISKAVVLATGTYLGGKIYVGDVSYESGPDGMFPSKYLPDALEKLGMSIRRFKTGTPARVLRSSIDFTDLEEQCGDEPVVPFSYDTDVPKENNLTVGCDKDADLTYESCAYVIATKGENEDAGFYYVNDDITVPAGKAYLYNPQAQAKSRRAKALKITFADGSEATGIESLFAGAETETPTVFYNLSGQKVDKNYKGVVIGNDGKKYVK